MKFLSSLGVAVFFLLQINITWQIEAPLATQPITCAPGWEFKPSSTPDESDCYKVFSKRPEEKKTWFEAQDFCRAIGGDLISFHSRLQVDMFQSYSSDPAWIGYRRDSNGTFVWSDNVQSNYEQWGDGEPNNMLGSEDCVEMWMDAPYFYDPPRWTDKNCEGVNDWICQMPTGKELKPAPYFSIPVDYNATRDGWLDWHGNQYFINKDLLSWDKAEAFCSSNHGHLAAINNNKERMFLYRQISRTTMAEYYIGLKQDFQQKLSWVSGGPVVYIAWDQNEPNFANREENCVSMSRDYGTWRDLNCGEPLASICKRSTDFATIIVTPETVMKGWCAEDWVPFQGKCYKFVLNGKDSNKIWKDARDYCINLGGNLLSIESVFEQAFVTTQLEGAAKDVWIGLNSITTRNKFIWTDGRPVDFTNWASDQPIIEDPEYLSTTMFNCVGIEVSQEDEVGSWHSFRCFSNRGFICKRNQDANIQPPTTTAPSENFGTFHHLGNHFYWMKLERMNWYEARQHCITKQADMVSILDAITQAKIMLRMQALNEPVWIGLNSKQTNGEYRWVDNSLLRYKKWGLFEPKLSKACVILDIDGKWKNAPCTNTYYSLCKSTT